MYNNKIFYYYIIMDGETNLSLLIENAKKTWHYLED
jgi:hypothetical protein